ncbi:MAG TPA: hypothetical protein VNA89_00965 [Gemmatimonadaceae bacterium]|nr:hypothetical protein [Gemmatimonadaceae bacterium]
MRLFVSLLAAAAVAACNSGDGPETEDLVLARSGSETQTGPAGGELAEPLTVLVTNSAGQPVPGGVVRFRVRSGAGASLSDTLAVSGIDGRASVRAVLGATQGTYTFSAKLQQNTGDEILFTATATAAPQIVSAVPQTVGSGDELVLTGSGFSTTGTNTVYFEQGSIVTPASVVSATATEIRVRVPPCLSTGNLTVRVAVDPRVRTNAVTVGYTQRVAGSALGLLQGIVVRQSQVAACLTLAGAGAAHWVIPQYATAAGSRTLNPFELGAVGAPLVSLAPAGADRPAVNQVQLAFDAWLREQEALYAPEGRLRRAQLASEPPSFAVAVGSQRTFRVLASLPQAGQNPTFTSVTGTLKYAGEHVLIYLDAAAPAGGFTDQRLTQFGTLFEEVLYEQTVALFGAESDIDRNDKVIMLLSNAVNRLTSAATCGTTGFVTGYFYGFDLASGGINSNKGELFYGLVPDPGGTLSCAHSLQRVEELVPSTFVHEVQHMISYGQKVIVRGGDQEEPWLNEGLSLISEENAGIYYETKYPPPSGRTNPSQFFPDSAGPFIVSLLEHAYDYLKNSDRESLTLFSQGSGTLAERGGIWLFLRWLGDQKGRGIYERLVQTKLTGRENLRVQAGEDLGPLMGDFGIAVLADSVPGTPRSQTPARYRFGERRNIRELFARLGALDSRYAGFPATPVTLPYGGAVSGSMYPGTMDFFGVTAGATDSPFALRFTGPSGAALPPSLEPQVAIFRYR